MKDNTNYYDKDYYKSHCGEEYERGHGWEEIFGNYAERIIKEINPQKTLDVGCARGFFVEALHDRGVEAYGIDISDYAIAEVRGDIKPFCKVQSALLPIGERYDLITCIEVLEHLDNKDIPLAIRRMCEASDDIIFSSTPFDYEEESHISIHSPEYWVEQFAYNGFYHDVQYDCSYIAVQTMRFRKMEKSKIDLIREYEKELFQKHQELVATKHRYKSSVENVGIYKDAYQKHVDMINEELNPKIEELTKQNLELSKTIQKYVDMINEELNPKIEELTKQNLELPKTIKSEMEQRCRTQIEQEVKRRKIFEEKYYECMELLETAEKKNIEFERVKVELEQAEIERRQDRIMIIELQQQLWNRNNSNVQLVEFIKEKRFKKSLEKDLLKRDASFWKPVYDSQYYAKHNKDIYEVYGNDEKALLQHFIQYGMYEGRVANPHFDINVYMSCNPDVVEAAEYDRRACYLHYITDGLLERRKAK